MTKDELLNKEFASACAAMIALNAFLECVDSLPSDSRANYQNFESTNVFFERLRRTRSQSKMGKNY